MEKCVSSEKLKNLPLRAEIHKKLVAAAKERGMTIGGLGERIIRCWLSENIFFNNNIASSNKLDIKK